MGRILRCVVAALTAFACEAWAQASANLQSLFVGLTQVSEVTLVTPLANGMAEVTVGAGAVPAARPVVPAR